MKRNICFSLSDVTLNEIDNKRGLIPRSRIIESLIVQGLANNNPSGSLQITTKMKAGGARSDKSGKTEAPCTPSNTRDEVDML
jgi:hypothetical protein